MLNHKHNHVVGGLLIGGLLERGPSYVLVKSCEAGITKLIGRHYMCLSSLQTAPTVDRDPLFKLVVRGFNRPRTE